MLRALNIRCALQKRSLAFRPVLHYPTERIEQPLWQFFYIRVVIQRAVLMILCILLVPGIFLRP